MSTPVPAVTFTLTLAGAGAVGEAGRIASSVTASARSVRRGLDLPALEHLGFGEDLEQLSIDLAVFHRIIQDLQRALLRYRLLVWPVSRRERVKNIRDGHHAGLHRDLRCAQLV